MIKKFLLVAFGFSLGLWAHDEVMQWGDAGAEE